MNWWNKLDQETKETIAALILSVFMIEFCKLMSLMPQGITK
jgi:hypothetical protein